MSKTFTTNLNIKNNFDDTAKDAEHLNDELNKTAQAQQAVNESFDKGSTFAERYGDELEPLTTRMGEAEDRLYELALAGDTTSKEYQELLQSVGNYRKVQIQTDMAVDGAATTMGQKLGSALTGVTSGFAATQGALALFGKENEALEKTLVKVQAALAIQQGVDGLRTSYKELGGVTGLVTKAQKALNFVMGLNPFVRITTAVVAVVAALAKFTSFLDPAIDKLKEFSDFIGISNFAEEEQNQDRKRRAAEEQARIESLRKQREQAFNQQQSQFDREIALAEAEGKSTVELTKQKIQASIAFQKEKVKEIQLQLDGLAVAEKAIAGNSAFSRAVLETARKDREEREAIIQELNNKIADSENQLKINVINNNKAKATSYKTYATDVKNSAREIEDLQIQLMEDGLEKELLINKTKFDRQREDITATGQQRLDLIDLFNQLELQKEKEIRDELDVFKLESFDGELAQMELVSAKQIETTKLTNEEIENQIKGSAKRQKEIDDKTTADKLANQKLVAETSLQLAHESLGAIGELANAFAKDDEKSAEKAFKINKAVGIAQAVVSTAQGIMAQLAVPQDALTGVNFVKAGIVAATGAAQIATISKSKFQGGTNDTPDIDTSGGGQAQAPSFNVVGDSGVNQLAQIQQQPVQAFVVSGEVTTSQALDRNRVQNATL